MAEELLTAGDVARLLGVNRQRVYQLVKTYPDFPKPVGEINRARVWLRHDIQSWEKRWDRRPVRLDRRGASKGKTPSKGRKTSGG